MEGRVLVLKVARVSIREECFDESKWALLDVFGFLVAFKIWKISIKKSSLLK